MAVLRESTNTFAKLVTMGLLLGLTACDPIYGISAATISSSPPDQTCIFSALSNTPGVHEAHELSRTYDGWLIAGDGPKHGTQIQYYSYKVGPHPMQTATLEIELHSDGQYHYGNFMLSMHERIPKQEIYDAYPVMVASIAEVSRMCNLNISTKMKYGCIGYDCTAVHSPTIP